LSIIIAPRRTLALGSLAIGQARANSRSEPMGEPLAARQQHAARGRVWRRKRTAAL
jgi:hypothetical protein